MYMPMQPDLTPSHCDDLLISDSVWVGAFLRLILRYNERPKRANNIHTVLTYSMEQSPS